MSTLFVLFNVETGSFVGSSLKGKFIENVAEVHLASGRVSVLDADGRDLLAGTPKAESGPECAGAAADIAAAFGVSATDKPVEGFDPRHQGRRA